MTRGVVRPRPSSDFGRDKTVSAHPVIVEDGAEVAGGPIRENGYDAGTWAEPLGDLTDTPNGGATRASHQQSFAPGQSAGFQESILVLDLEDVIQDFKVHGGNGEFVTQAFNQVWLRGQRAVAPKMIGEDRAHRIYGNDLDPGPAFRT